MKTILWLAGGLGLGLAVYLIVTAPVPEYSTGSTDVERAARKAAGWGAKQQVKGSGTGLLGKVKEGVGSLTGDDQLAGEGQGDQVAGGIRKVAGQAAEAAGQVLHDLNI
jgi:uncharacterized protein YjbJ (UPF0337 family)